MNTNLNPVIAAMHKRNKIETIITIMAFVVCCALNFYAGYAYRELKLMENAKFIFKEKKTTYTVEDLERVIFGEPQV